VLALTEGAQSWELLVAIDSRLDVLRRQRERPRKPGRCAIPAAPKWPEGQIPVRGQSRRPPSAFAHPSAPQPSALTAWSRHRSGQAANAYVPGSLPSIGETASPGPQMYVPAGAVTVRDALADDGVPIRQLAIV